MAARTKPVVANIDPSPATDIPDAVDVAKGGEHKGNTFGDNSAGFRPRTWWRLWRWETVQVMALAMVMARSGDGKG